jgi:hypothetical protein
MLKTLQHTFEDQETAYIYLGSKVDIVSGPPLCKIEIEKHVLES